MRGDAERRDRVFPRRAWEQVTAEQMRETPRTDDAGVIDDRGSSGMSNFPIRVSSILSDQPCGMTPHVNREGGGVPHPGMPSRRLAGEKYRLTQYPFSISHAIANRDGLLAGTPLLSRQPVRTAKFAITVK